MLDIISLGDAGLDTFVQLDEATVNCSLNKTNCQFCFNYADKIPVTGWQEAIGGNAANNAVATSRLGLAAALWTIVGQDKIGAAIRAAMAAEGVAAKLIMTDKKQPTNQSFVINFQGERTILIHHNSRHYRLPNLPPSRWLYLTSMGEKSERIFTALNRHLKKRETKLAFNPGTWQMKLGLAGLRPILKMTAALFLNREEAARILDLPGDTDKHVLTKKLLGLGPGFVVLTDGEAGAHGSDGSRCWHIPVRPNALVADKTGAGDGFAGGFLSALILGKGVGEALRWGALNAAAVIGRIGPQAGLLRLGQMKRELRHYKNLLAQAC